jgi:hypothetical protein
MKSSRLVLDGALYALVTSVYLMVIIALYPRLFLQDYPEAIQAQVPPKTSREKRLMLIAGVPFLIILFVGPLLSTLALNRRLGGQAPFVTLAVNAFGVAFAFNLIDWLVLDWLIFCTWTPRFMVIPGSQGNPAYQDYGYHARGFVIGTGISLITGLIVGGLVALLG